MLRESVDYMVTKLRVGSCREQVAANIIEDLLRELEQLRWEKEQSRRRAALGG
jgi:hypothetical protein